MNEKDYDPTKRYQDKRPEDVDVSVGSGPIGGDHPIENMTPQEEQFYADIRQGFQIMPTNPELVRIVKKLAALGLVKISKVGTTGSEYYSNAIKK